MQYQRSPSQNQQQRFQRHEKLLKMIKNYKRTTQDHRKLQKIKENTVMQINLRYIKSNTNKSYKFPKSSNPQSDSQDQSEEKISLQLSKKNSTYEDLMSQNQYNNNTELGKKLYAFEVGRRVKSLDREHQAAEQWRITTRTKNKMPNKQQSEKQFRKIHLQPIKIRNNQSTAKLQKKLSPLKFKKQNIKTEKTQQKVSLMNPFSISSVIGKKLMTQVASNNIQKLKGLQMIIKKTEHTQSPKRMRGKRLFQDPAL